MRLKEGSAKESGVRRRPKTKLLAARFTTNLRNKLQSRGTSSNKAHSIGMKTFKMNKEVMIDNHLLLRVLESLICLLRIRPTLLDIVKTLVAWAYRVLVGLESAVAIGLLLILALFGFQKIQLFELRV